MIHSLPLCERVVHSSRSKTVPPLPLASDPHRGTYKTWTEAQMEKAMNALAMDENLYVRRAALQFNVLKSTLGDRMSGSVIPGAKSGPPKLLTTSEETELVEFLIRSGAVGYARSRKEVLSLVLDIVQRKGKPVTSISNGWWESFRRRHPSLVLRGAAPLSFQYSCSSLRS